jgi:hypothetical protein
MVRRILSPFVAVAIVLSVLGSSTLSAAEQRAASWHHRYWNSLWWYWMPEGRWVYWQNNQWNNYPISTIKLVSYTEGGVNTRDGLPRSEASGQSCNAAAVSGIPQSSGHAVPPRAYQGDVGQSDIGPLYGKARSSTASHSSSANAEAGPFYDHADSLFDTGINRSHFFGY